MVCLYVCYHVIKTRIVLMVCDCGSRLVGQYIQNVQLNCSKLKGND